LQSRIQYSTRFNSAHARIAQGPPNNRCWAVSFFSAAALVPDPQLEQVPNKFNLQTSQLIPQAPVGMASPNIYLEAFSRSQWLSFLHMNLNFKSQAPNNK
jgi:hypothetical protein